MAEHSNLPAAPDADGHGEPAHGALDYSTRDERGRFILPLEEHHQRITDVDARAAKRAERQVAWLFVLGAACFAGAVAAFVGFSSHELIHVPMLGNVSASNFWLGTLIGLGSFFLGAAAIHWARRLMPGEEAVDHRHSLRGDEDSRASAIEQFKRGAAESGFLSRPLVRRTMLGAMALFPLPLVVLLADLGPAPKEKLRHTMWGDKPATRIINQGSGELVRPEHLAVGGLINAIPEGLEKVEEEAGTQNERAKSSIILVRMNPSEIKAQQGQGWDYEGILAYSKICTHVGCPISLYQQRTHALLCPCHQSTFDLSDAGRVVFGPAARHMPQLRIGVDSEGYLVSLGDFAEPVGPSFWERG